MLCRRVPQTRRLVSIEDQDTELLTAMPETSSIHGDLHRESLAESIGAVLSQLAAEDRFLLHAYHLDGRNLAASPGFWTCMNRRSAAG
jgi:hypothetical protein